MEIVLSKAKTLKKSRLDVNYPIPNSAKLNFPKLKYLWLSIISDEYLEKFFQSQLPSLERLRIGTQNLEFLAQNCNRFLANAPKLKSIQLTDGERFEKPLSEEALCEIYEIFVKNNVFIYLGTVFDTSSQDQFDKFIFHERYRDRDPRVFVKYEQELRKFISWCRKNEKYGDVNDVN